MHKTTESGQPIAKGEPPAAPRQQQENAAPAVAQPAPTAKPAPAAKTAPAASAAKADAPQAAGADGRPFTTRPLQPEKQEKQPERPARVVAQPVSEQPLQAQPVQPRAATAGAVAAAGTAQVPARIPPAQPVARPVPPPPPPPQPVRAPASSAQPRRRHWLLLISFILIVILPVLISAWYLWARTVDQYVSSVGFSVRQEDSQPSVDLLGGLAALGGVTSSASDSDILYHYIRSVDMVETIDQQLDLRRRFSLEWPHDFVFAYNPNGTIEDLTEQWQRQVQVYHDSSTGLITLNVSAFTPADAREIAEAILEESTKKINELSSIARNDATRHAREELEKARVELTTARQEMTAYRMRTQIVDPQADLAGQMGVLTGMQAQLAEQMVQHDMLMDNALPTDNRVIQSQKRIDALQNLIQRERSKFGREGHGPGGESYAQLVAEYEKLAVDREFAEGAYRSARIAYESSLAEAQRQSRYLAPHITPRTPEASTQPNRLRLLALVAGMLLMGWSILALIYYSVRDRG